MTASQIRYTLLVLLTSLIVMSCRGVDQNDGAGGIGDLTIGITDGPADQLKELNLYITGIEVTPTGGTPILIEDIEEEFFDLAKLQGGLREKILNDAEIADGSYESIRLIINEADSFIKFNNDEEYPITIPTSPIDESANLILDVDIFFDDDNDKEDFTIDIDLRKSIRVDTTQTPPVYTLHPRLRIVETSRTGSLTGTVHADLITDSRCSSQRGDRDGNTVYLFLDNGVPVQDLRDDANDPYATTTVDVQSDNSGVFSFAYLPVQSYRAVFTCDAFNDDPAIPNASVDLESPVEVDIVQGSTATVSINPL